MESYKEIENKIRQFIVKYYTNELIKGAILFFSLGCFYFFVTLFLEYFLWLEPTARTFLFWTFIGVEVFLLVRFIFFPVFKLIGLQNQISFAASSTIIGNHFPEVKDKLLNILQLKENNSPSDLILASIEQKSAELRPIPFVNAIDFKENATYLKFALVPIFIGLIVFLSGNKGMFTESLTRVVNYKTAYHPPAPFTFVLMNDDLNVVQGKSLTILVKTAGKVTPDEAKIIFDNQQYYLQNNQNGTFSYTFSEVNVPTIFYLTANGIRSNNFRIDVVKTPTITAINMELSYPKYLEKRLENVANTGNAIVPEGTKISWRVLANQTNNVAIISSNARNNFASTVNGVFEFSKKVRQNFDYQISSSNQALKDYESLPFAIRIIKDEFPAISVKSNRDSISRGTFQFAGQLSDDYGISRLDLVYYNETSPENKQVYPLTVSKESIQNFFYNFPEGLNVIAGVNYELFFQVFDNDEVNGHKRAKSNIFKYRLKTSKELEQESLNAQRNTIADIEKSITQQRKEKETLKKLQNDLQDKKNMNWSDQKKVADFVKRQEQYQNRVQKQTERLQENLGEKKEANETLQNKKEELAKRIEELKKLDRQQQLLDEIEKMADKLNKEELLEKAKELAAQNKQKERSLERILELTKRFYIEQKTLQIASKLEELSTKQDSIAEVTPQKALVEQEQLNKEFKAVEKELDELQKDNERLKEPMQLPDIENEREAAAAAQERAKKSLTGSNSPGAKKAQKKSAQKMKEMSAKMQKAMLDMQGDAMEENVDDLRKILENLVTFSFKQEQLMNTFETISTTHPEFGKKLKKQNELKTYFEHIDDSLYVLSMRVPRISAKIEEDLGLTHYNLEQSLDNFSENRFTNGISNQRYVMTGTNNLADYLSTVLTNMKNSMSMSKGKGKSGDQEFSLPDLIQKQQGLSEKMKEGERKGGQKPGNKSGQKPGEGNKAGAKGGQGKSGSTGKNGNEGKKGTGKEGDGENEDLNGELFKIYQEQSRLRQELQDAILRQEESSGRPGNGAAKRALKTMEDLENEILEKGFNAATVQKMQNLSYQLLKLDKAALEQGEDKKRKARSSLDEIQKQRIKDLQFKKLFYNQIEILNRQSLPLRQDYKKKVQEYFSNDQRK